MLNYLVVFSYFGGSRCISDNYPYRVQAKLIPKGHHIKKLMRSTSENIVDPLGMSDSE